MSYDSRFERRRSPNSVPHKPTHPEWGKSSRRPVSRQRKQPPQPPTPPTASVRKREPARLYIVWAILVMGGLILAINLIYLQIGQAGFLRKRAQEQQLMRAQPFVPRRPILDRNGALLALDRPVYTLYAHPKLFKKSKGEIALQLGPLLGGIAPDLNESGLIGKFNRAESGIRIADGISPEVADRISQQGIDGLELTEQQQRFYPQQDLAAEVVGYVDSDRKGQAGVEYSQQNLLERTMPSIKFSRAANGTWVPDRLTTGFVQYDDLQLQLTLDSRVQRVARTALKQQMEKFGAKRGAVIVMDVKDGEVRSLVSEPTYDPNKFFNFGVERFKNWVLTDVYEPGSTFKPINIAIALEAGVVTPDTVFNDEGQIFVDGWPIANYDYRRAGPRGPQTVTQILKDSSNVGMVHIMAQVQPQIYYKALERLGLGQTTGSDLPFEVPSQLKPREQFISSRVESATTAFGQGFSLTPIQLVQLMGTLGNGGTVVTPHVVKGLFNREGQSYWELRKPTPRQIFSPATTQAVLTMMEQVVSDGTGKASQISGYRIAGKTGTAQKANASGGYSDRAIVTSFVAIVPADAPRYVVFAVIDEPQSGTGGVVAAPVVKSVIEALISLDKIPPSVVEPKPSIP